MSKPAASFFDDEDTPELRFEEDGKPGPHPPRRPANYASAPHMPAYGVADDHFTVLTNKEENVLKLEQELEKTRREARELRARQDKEDRFVTGRREICERIARNLSKLDRELYNAQKAVEEISAARDIYQHHLGALRSIEFGKGIHHSDDELDAAIGSVEDAESEYGKTNRRLATVLPQIMPEVAHGGGVPDSFATWLRAGFAFTLPAMAITIVVILLSKYLP